MCGIAHADGGVCVLKLLGPVAPALSTRVHCVHVGLSASRPALLLEYCTSIPVVELKVDMYYISTQQIGYPYSKSLQEAFDEAFTGAAPLHPSEHNRLKFANRNLVASRLTDCLKLGAPPHPPTGQVGRMQFPLGPSLLL